MPAVDDTFVIDPMYVGGNILFSRGLSRVYTVCGIFRLGKAWCDGLWYTHHNSTTFVDI